MWGYLDVAWGDWSREWLLKAQVGRDIYARNMGIHLEGGWGVCTFDREESICWTDVHEQCGSKEWREI
jgi:hypothetical protein